MSSKEAEEVEPDITLLKGERTYGDLLDGALACTTREEADAYVQTMTAAGFAKVRSDLGYLFGYLTTAERERLQWLFDAPHPHFGYLTPTPDQAFEIGQRMGAALKAKCERRRLEEKAAAEPPAQGGVSSCTLCGRLTFRGGGVRCELCEQAYQAGAEAALADVARAKKAADEVPFQTSGDRGSCGWFATLALALADAGSDRDAWKVSFTLATGERVCLVRDRRDGAPGYFYVEQIR